MKEKVQGYQDLAKMKQIWPAAPIYSRINMYVRHNGFSLQETQRHQRKGRLLQFGLTSCQLTNDDPGKCMKLQELKCDKKPTKACRMIALDLLIKRIVRQTCVRNILSMTSAGNYSSKFASVRHWIDLLEVLTIISWVALILLFYREMLITKHVFRLKEPKIEHYSLLVKNLKKDNLNNLPINRLAEENQSEYILQPEGQSFDLGSSNRYHISSSHQSMELQLAQTYQQRPFSMQNVTMHSPVGLVPILRKTFENSLAHVGVPVRVSAINLCFDTKDYLELKRSIDKCKTLIAKLRYEEQLGQIGGEDPDLRTENLNLLPELNSQQLHPSEGELLLAAGTQLQQEVSKPQQKIKRLQEVITEKEIELRTLEFSFSLGASSPHFLGSAYITLESMAQKEQIYHTYVARERFFAKFLSQLGCLDYSARVLKLTTGDNTKAKYILLDAAAGPEDIAWGNLGINFRSKQYRQILNMLVIIAMMAANFFVIYQTKNYLSRLLSAKSHDHRSLRYNPVLVAFLGNFIMAVSTLILNTVLAKLITHMIEFHGLPTETNFTLTKVKLIWRSQFVMKAIIPAVAASMVLDIYGENGYIYNVFSNIAKYALVIPILSRVTNVDIWFSRYMRQQVQAFLADPKRGAKFTLGEAKELWLDDVFRVSSMLTKYLRSLATVVFVAPIFPVATLMYPLLGIQTHFSYKYALLNQSMKSPAFADKSHTPPLSAFLR